MSAAPRVSVITPTYNHAAYIEACIGSVRAQTVADWELIVVDDGSADDTAARVDALGDARVRLLRLPHRGLGALHETYNAALAEARGEFVAILEGDDLWPPAKLERQLPLFDDGDVVIAWGASVYVDAGGRRIRRVAKLRASRGGTVKLPLDGLFMRLTRENILTPAVTVMVRTAALRRLGGFRQAGARNVVDLPTWLALCATHAGSACFLDEVLGCYRVHAAQTTALKLDEMVADRLSIVLAAVADMDGTQRRRVGWTDAAAREVEARTALYRGVAALQHGRFADARGRFGDVLRLSRRPADRLRARAGLLSAAAGVDVFGAARSIRDRVAP